MPIQRREFLVALAAGALIHGLDRLALAGDDAKQPAPPKQDEPPAWFKDALAEMKATCAPGVAIVLPDDKDAREALRDDLQTLLRSPPFVAQLHFVEAVYVLVDGRLVGAAKGETAVLLEPDGRRAKGAAVAFTREKFAETVRPLLRDGDRLAKRAKAARDADVEKLFADAALDDADKADAAAAKIQERFATIAPAVIESYEGTKPGNLNTRLGYAIVAAFTRRRDADFDKRPMPFGARWKRDVTPAPSVDPCPACGEMMVSPRARDLLELLAKDANAAK